ncbi:MAG: SemiSWEET transporter [Planctomycetota bacterium]
MEISTIIGLVGGAFTTFAYLPQVVKSWKTRRTDDISLTMLLVLATGETLWLSYGILLNQVPVILANLFGILLVLSVLIAKLKYG